MDEEELKEFVGEETFVDEEEINMDYEFDAPRFHDFTRAETDSDAGESERWFDSAGNYPPSPFVIKLNWRQGFRIGAFEDVNANKNRGLTRNHNKQENSQAKFKSTVERSSTLMKPTASHLAKQNLLVHSIRLHKKLGNLDDNTKNSSVSDDLAITKRQKLEAGYSSKEAHLKHKAILLHKVPKKVRLDGVSANARPKATIPKEPNLETAHRAERRRYKVIAESGEQAKSISYKGRRANKKIVKAPCFQITRRNKQLASEFEETIQMPSCNSLKNETAEGKSFLVRSNSANGLRQEKYKTINNFEALSSNKKKLSNNGKFCISRNIKRATTTVTRVIPTDARFQDEPPVNLFRKLCLTSEASKNTTFLHIEGTRVINQENKVH